jgi:hypothetical protein
VQQLHLISYFSCCLEHLQHNMCPVPSGRSLGGSMMSTLRGGAILERNGSRVSTCSRTSSRPLLLLEVACAAADLACNRWWCDVLL